MSTWDSPPEFKRDLERRYGLTCPPRWGTPRHPEFPTYGPAVGRVMAKLGTPPMPWQQYMLDVALEVDPSNEIMMKNHSGIFVPQPVFVHREVGLAIPRQQGKTVSVLAMSLHRMMTWSRQMVVYAAQNRIAARDKWEDDFVEAVEQSVLKSKFHPRKSFGHEALICKKTRSMLGLTANTEKAGHGDVLDLGLIDEAFSHEDDRLEQAFGPAMITRRMAQKWWLSAGGTERSMFLNRKREVGRQLIQDYWAHKIRTNVAYFEWFPGEEDEAPRHKFTTWLLCLPALCPDPPCRCDPKRRWRHTITEDVVRAEYTTMDPAEFDRAYLNRTRRKTPPPDANIPTKEWPQRVNKASRRGEQLAFGIDITPQRDHGSIAVYSVRADGKGHGELAVFRPGTHWMADVVKHLIDKWDPIAVGLDAVTGSPAATLKDDLEKLKIEEPEDPQKPERGQLWIPNLYEVATACGALVDDIRNGRLEHTDQKQLNIAVAGARTRPLGDAWAIARKSALVNISPFVALMLARGAYLNRIQKLTPVEAEPSMLMISGTSYDVEDDLSKPRQLTLVELVQRRHQRSGLLQ